MSFFDTIADAVYPPTCTGCNRHGYWLCGWCINKLQPAHPECMGCRKVSNRFNTHSHCNKGIDRSIIAWRYNSLAKRIMKRFKYQYGYKTIIPLLSLLPNVVRRNFKKEEGSVIIPTPLHKLRELDRGFNQSTVIAEVVSKELDIPMRQDLIQRRRYTESQASQDVAGRNSNLTDAFEVSNEILQYKKVILIDDVMTTGGTMLEIAKGISEDVGVESFALFRATYKTKAIATTVSKQ